MNNKQIFIGADISKSTIDFDVINSSTHSWKCINNTVNALRRYLRKITNEHSECDLYLAMENTGRYNWHLYKALEKLSIKVFVINAIHLKRSMGLVRGKSDRVDAKRIAEHLQLHHPKLKQWIAPRKGVKQLILLLTERNSKMKIIKQLKCQFNESCYLEENFDMEDIQSSTKTLICHIESIVQLVEKKIQTIIIEDKQLNKIYQLITSVTGVGKVLAWNMLVKTNEFRYITSPRKMASYAGVVPFEHSSGVSIRRKERVSFYADKSLKSLLHMSSMRAIRIQGELQDYYNRKVKEGKNKMSVLNAIRNKLIHRMYATLKNETPYVNNYANQLILS